MKTAVLGASGQLGSALITRLGALGLAVRRHDLDIADLNSIRPWMLRERPEIIVNCAAYTAVDTAESDEESARTVNALAVGELAAASREYGSEFVTFSTDYVFDGMKSGGYVESDPTNPLSVYGQTKLEGERLALAANPRALIIRTSWLLSASHPGFAHKILDALERGSVRVVDDQRGRPTIADDLAGAVLRAIELRIDGIVHLANEGETTWYLLAKEIASLSGHDADRVIPVSTAEHPRPAIRPKNSVLDSERLDTLGLGPLPHHRESLTAIVHQIMGRRRK